MQGAASSPKLLVHRRQRPAAILGVQHWPTLDERRCTRFNRWLDAPYELNCPDGQPGKDTNHATLGFAKK